MRDRNRHNFHSEKHKKEWSLSKVESREIHSESPIQVTGYQCLAVTLESHESETPDSRFRIADSVQLGHALPVQESDRST